jgi:hypothetical protein
MQIGEKGIENMLVNMVYLERGKKLILKGMYSKEKKTLFVYLFTWECAKNNHEYGVKFFKKLL